MPSAIQQRSVQRKLVYFGLIVALFVINTFFWRGVASPLTGSQPPSWTVAAQARDLELTEESLGEADLLGSTVRLGLTGSRGLAVTLLWHAAIDKQRLNQWNELEFLVRSLTKLQPHFRTPWLFQSWNLAYNVSVENDRVADKYFYISRGIELLAQGERVNRDNPDFRYWIGFYYQNKFGVSDEQNTLRSLLQLSNIKPTERDPGRFRISRSSPVNLDELEKFCRDNPQLVRRLREHVLKPNTPTDFVDFLEANRKLPTRFYDAEVDGGPFVGKLGELKPPEQQFPILPTSKPFRFKSGIDEPTAADPLGDWFGNYQFARTWYSYAQDPLPDPEPMTELKDRAERIRNQKGRRMPYQPSEVHFRQSPALAESGEASLRLQKEGWFDESGWSIDGNRTGLSRWFPAGRNVVIGQGPRNGTYEIWRDAYNMWRELGISLGLYLEPTEEARLQEKAREFRERYNIDPADMARAFRPDTMPTPSLAESLLAHRQLFFRAQSLKMMNYPHHYYRAEAERDRDLIEARKLVYEADEFRKAAEPERALAAYQKGFDLWKTVLGKEANREFRNDKDLVQADLYEAEYRYLEVLGELRGGQLRPALIARDMLTEAADYATSFGSPALLALGMSYGLVADTRSLPLPINGPFDGNAPDGQPWIAPDVVQSTRSRMGLAIAPVAPPPPRGGPPAPR